MNWHQRKTIKIIELIIVHKRTSHYDYPYLITRYTYPNIAFCLAQEIRIIHKTSNEFV